MKKGNHKKKRIKILLVNDYGHIVGGAEKILFDIYNNLITKQDIEIKLATNKNTKTKDNLTSFNNIKIKNKINPLYYFNFISYIQIRKIIKKYNPDIIHYHNILYELSPSVLFVPRDIKKIMTLHDYEAIKSNKELIKKVYGERKNKKYAIQNTISNIFNKIRFFIFKKGLKNMILISPSEYLKKEYQKYFNNRIIVINNFVKQQKNIRYHNNGPILYVGRLVKEKGIQNIIKAAHECKINIGNKKILIIGEGEYKNELKNMLKKDDNIIILGKKKSLEKYYNSASLVIVPSIYQDNFPTVCLEAISYGVPVIASRVGGIPEIIKDNYNGYLFNAGNYKELAKKINLFYSKKKGYTMSKNAHISSKKYESEKNIKRLIEIYKNE